MNELKPARLKYLIRRRLGAKLSQLSVYQSAGATYISVPLGISQDVLNKILDIALAEVGDSEDLLAKRGAYAAGDLHQGQVSIQCSDFHGPWLEDRAVVRC